MTVVFRDSAEAEQVCDYLNALGCTQRAINLRAPDQSRSAGSLVLQGMGLGGAIGTVAVGAAAAYLAIGTTIVLPSTSLIVDGPLVAGFTGAGVGGVAGGILGALIGASLSGIRRWRGPTSQTSRDALPE